MPRLEDINKITEYEKNLYLMSDEEFLEYATKPEMNDLYNEFSEADKTAFLIRAMMIGGEPESFYNDLIYERNNMYTDGPKEVRTITDANRENPDFKRKIQYDVYRAILYSDQDKILPLASKTTAKMTASDIIEKHDSLKDIFTAHLQVPLNEGLSEDKQKEMVDSAKRERDAFLQSLGYKNYYDEEDEIDLNGEHVYIPEKDRVIDINAIGDYVEKNEFTVADKAGSFSVVIKPLKEGEAAESLLKGYDLKETSPAEKRNMLLSFALQGMGRFAITDAIQKIQADEHMRNMIDLCVLTMDSNEIIENKDLIKDAVLSGSIVNEKSYRLYSKADALGRKKKIANPFIKKEEDNLSENGMDEDDSFDKEDDNQINIENENKIIGENLSVNIGNKDFNIEQKFVRPEAEFDDLSNETKNANVWIDEIKEDYGGDPYSADRAAARILAARILVDSERGVLKSLKKPVKGTDIDDLSKRLLENETFRNFLNSLQVEEKRNLLTHSGHGGVFEDKFKEYLLKLEAGKLHNDRILDRFMPKAYQRIEELQRQAAKKGPHDGIYREAAEVMLIRAMIGAGRNQPDKLAAKIPTFSNLAEEVEELSQSEHNPRFVGACGNEKTIKDFQAGHGGQMIENMFHSTQGSNEHIAITQEFRKYCTAEYRFKKLQERAEKILTDLDNRIKEDYESLSTRESCMEAKEVLAEAVVMAMTIARDDHPSKEISPTLKTVRTGTDIIKKDETFNRELFPKRNPEEFYKQLKAFAKAEKPGEYANELFVGLRGVYMKEHPEALNKGNKNQNKMEKIQPEKGKNL
ncbi:MAG: hypothetical protein IKP92_00675 [Lachnospiraceae bacterium]|nr:hypothetical protein [Lachnospiraceae bacterium]